MKGEGKYQQQIEIQNRKRILEYLDTVPSATLREISRNTTIQRPVVTKHIRALVKQGKVKREGKKFGYLDSRMYKGYQKYLEYVRESKEAAKNVGYCVKKMAECLEDLGWPRHLIYKEIRKDCPGVATKLLKEVLHEYL